MKKIPITALTFVIVLPFFSAAYDDKTFTVSSATQWTETVNQIKSGGNNKTYTINVTRNFKLKGVTFSGYSVNDVAGVTNSFGDLTGITVTITGNKKISLAADSEGFLLAIGANQTVIINNLKLEGHKNNTSSLVFVLGTNAALTMNGSAAISKNIAAAVLSSGGGVYINKGSLTMNDNAMVSQNISGTGGGVHVNKGSFTMNGNAAVSKNTSGNGSGVYVKESSFTMNGNTKVSQNTIKDSFGSYGGGVYAFKSSFTMSDNATVSGNTSTAIHPFGKSSGGGVYVSDSTFTMSGNTAISKNITTGTSSYGGGVGVDKGSFVMSDNAKVSQNTVNARVLGFGGGVSVSKSSSFSMSGNATVSQNTANTGGGVHVHEGAFTMNDNSIVSGNIANSGGGGSVWGGTFNMAGGTVYGDVANGAPAGLANTVKDANGAALHIGGTVYKGKKLLQQSGIAKYGNGTNIEGETTPRSINTTITGKR